ncbi:MAG: 50S ribosomal protein L31 [Candidatus Pacebacteria bacterium]|nr:50S ribosomal protein L31 [Candidatus Paceibacterota bacterium]
MKKKVHPTYYPQAQVVCACGNTFTTGSTKPKIEVEICSACHPFFTGEMKYVDTLGKVEKFQKKQAKAKKEIFVKKKIRRETSEKIKRLEEERKERERPKSLREMLKKG